MSLKSKKRVDGALEFVDDVVADTGVEIANMLWKVALTLAVIDGIFAGIYRLYGCV